MAVEKVFFVEHNDVHPAKLRALEWVRVEVKLRCIDYSHDGVDTDCLRKVRMHENCPNHRKRVGDPSAFQHYVIDNW